MTITPTRPPETNPRPPHQKPPENKSNFQFIRKLMAIMGYGMLFGGTVIAVITVSRPLHKNYEIPAPPTQDSNLFVWFMQHFSYHILAILFVIFLSFVGYLILARSKETTPSVIPDEDRELLEPLVSNGNKDAIAQYVILSSLSGITGSFQQIGFTGLPLATSGLTMLFCLLTFFKPEFFDLAKLSLGAFIGSFVQRSSDSEQIRQNMQRREDAESVIQSIQQGIPIRGTQQPGGGISPGPQA